MMALLAVVLQTASWRSAQPIVVAPARSGRYVRLALPGTLDPGERSDYADVRIVDARGQEQPYVVDPDCGELSEHDAWGVRSYFVRGAHTEIFIDAGDTRTPWRAVQLRTSRRSFYERATVEASSDGAHWRPVRTDAIVYQRPQAPERDASIGFSPTRDRWLLVRIFDPRAAFEVSSVRLSAGAESRPEATRVVQQEEWQRTEGSSEQWTAVLPTARTAQSVRFEVPGTQAFSRAISVEVSDDGTNWSSIAQGQIERFGTSFSREISFDETRSRFWRVAVDNGDDEPIPGLAVDLRARAHELVFFARPATAYRLLSGNDDVAIPQYDLADRLEHEDWSADEKASLAATPSRRPLLGAGPLVWRDPIPVTLAYLAATGAILGVALRLVMRPPALE
ncbi:MAG TPA: DUF3999 family protein [Candidatus Baltobacteraceae bacterium]